MALSNLTKVQTLGIGSNIEVVGVITTGEFKSGTSNLHSTGVELTNLNVSGIATIGGNLSIGGTLTYQDVTNIDSVGLITARSGINVSGGQLDVGSNIKLGNAGVLTATSFRGDGSQLTGISVDSTKIETGNTKVETIDTGSDGHIKFTTEGSERLRITSDGNIGFTTLTGSTDLANNSSALKHIHLGNEYWSGTAGDYRSAKIVMYQTNNNNFYGFGISTGTLEVHGSRISFFNGSGNVKTSALEITSSGEYHFNKSHLYIKDKLGHWGNVGTYLRFPQNDTITFETNNNAERMRIDSDGNLSLGKGSAANASYGRNFQIHHDGTSGAALQLTDNNTGSGGGDGFHIISTSQIAYLWQRENANMVFGTQGIARWNMYGSNGHFAPHADSTYDIGTNTVRVRNIYADNLYGSGANLTSLPSSPPPNNFLINGAMLVNVRGTNHQTANSFNPVTSAIYTLDRWKVFNSNSFDTDSAKVVQDGGHPAQGFHRSIMMNIGNTETPSSNQICGFQQKIEAQNLQSLCYGQSTAKTMTLSFWVYSNKTGTYCVQIMQDDVNKYVLYEYTISSSNTWEKKTITIAGNTADAINNDNGIGLEVNWTLCVGSGRQASATSSWTSGGYYVATSNQVNLWDHADNYFKMTGCQLQTGSTATDFVHEDIGTTLRKCQRYFYMACGPDGGGYETIGTGMIYYSGTGYASCYFPVTMRTQPSLVALSGTSGAYMYQTLLSNTAAYTHQISLDSSKTSLNSASVSCACPSSRNGEAFRLSAHFSHDANGGQSFVNFDAEL